MGPGSALSISISNQLGFVFAGNFQQVRFGAFLEFQVPCPIAMTMYLI